MTLADLLPLAHHLWQSTLCAVAAWLLSLALRKNRAATRYWLWLAVSVKFLIPFSWLVIAGSFIEWRAASAIPPDETEPTIRVKVASRRLERKLSRRTRGR